MIIKATTIYDTIERYCKYGNEQSKRFSLSFNEYFIKYNSINNRQKQGGQHIVMFSIIFMLRGRLMSKFNLSLLQMCQELLINLFFNNNNVEY